MAQIYKENEAKIRPDVYYRYSNKGTSSVTAVDGINALVVKASWGPAGETKAYGRIEDVRDAYGECDGTDMAAAIFEEGASKVYVYRVSGTGGKKATGKLGDMTVTSKWEGVYPVKVKIQKKPGDDTIKQCLVLVNNTVKETFGFTSGATDSAALAEQLKSSVYVEVADGDTPAAVAEAEVELTGGVDPTVTAEDYVKGFYALEPYFYNVICIDTVDDAIQGLLKEYVNAAVKVGKFPIAVLSTDASKSFPAKLEKAKSYNDAQTAFIGNVYIDMDGKTVAPIMAVARLAGAISATPANKSIIHRAIKDASDIPEKYTNTQYEEAIMGGMVLFSVSSDGQVWFDSGVTTLTQPADNQDDGWKKLKRTKVRNELMHRIDTVMEKKIGKVNCDADGIASIIQGGNGVLKDMANEKKIFAGGSFYIDPDMPATSDSAWFIIDVDDIDTLEKIYLNYRFSTTPTA